MQISCRYLCPSTAISSLEHERLLLYSFNLYYDTFLISSIVPSFLFCRFIQVEILEIETLEIISREQM